MVWFHLFLLKIKLFFVPILKTVWKIFNIIDFLLSVTVISFLIYQIGFDVESEYLPLFRRFYRIVFVFAWIDTIVVFVRNLFVNKKLRSFFYFSIGFLFTTIMAGVFWFFPQSWMEECAWLVFFKKVWVLYFVVAAHSVFTLSQTITRSLRSQINPARLFVCSFLLIIFIGCGLLMLPNATYSSISFLDALFTSVSAVCVTGLSVINVSATLTPIGKIILLALIQVGGIGIMTFTSFFGLSLMGKYSVQNRLVIKDLINSDEGTTNIFQVLRNILLLTIVVELIGAYLFFVAIDGQTWSDAAMAVFHSVSAFCNAGFSSVPDGLLYPTLCHNYAVHWIIAILVVLGGIGFPIMFNFFRLLHHVVKNKFLLWMGRQSRYRHVPNVLTCSTRIVFFTTLFLLVGGTVFFLVSEYNYTLSSLDWKGKITTAFFMSVTPRTAGFNTFNMVDMSNSTVYFMIFLMWVGASPMSTGGGIKTTTFAIAFMNIWNTLRGYEKVEIHNRQIPQSVINRCFLIIFISISIIFTGVLFMSFFDPWFSLKELLFECVSAVSTAGLSLNVTSSLSTESRVVLILLMFIGRIGFISLLSSFIKPKTRLKYQLPSENIIIN